MFTLAVAECLPNEFICGNSSLAFEDNKIVVENNGVRSSVLPSQFQQNRLHLNRIVLEET